MIRSVLISGYLDDGRLARVLGEILDIGAAAEPNGKLVVVCEGGSLPALLAFMECVFEDAPTRALIERADVKIYQAFSAAALLAFWMGGRREMAADTRIGFHLPLLTLKSWQVESRRLAHRRENRQTMPTVRITPRTAKPQNPDSRMRGAVRPGLGAGGEA